MILIISIVSFTLSSATPQSCSVFQASRSDSELGFLLLLADKFRISPRLSVRVRRVRTAIRPDGNDANCPDILMENTWQIFGPAHYHFKQLDENTSSSLS